jgi:hypothetical protein
MGGGRLRVMLPAVWAGVLICIAFIAAPVPFTVLARDDAGRVAANIFAQEARLSLAFAMVLFFLERSAAQREAAEGRGSVFSLNLGLVLGALFCTVAGYYALEPMMASARAGQGPVSFAALHGAASSLFALKAGLVLALSWRVARAPADGGTPPPLNPPPSS